MTTSTSPGDTNCTSPPSSKFYGRQAELRELCDAYERILTNTTGVHQQQYSPKELILIEGPPGVGKSRLLQEFRQRVLQPLPGKLHSSSSSRYNKSQQRSNGSQPRRQAVLRPIFVSGKVEKPLNNNQNTFEEAAAAAQPYAGLVDACSELCRQVLGLPQVKDVVRLCDRIRRALGDEWNILAKLVPELRDVVEHVHNNNQKNNHNADEDEDNSESDNEDEDVNEDKNINNSIRSDTNDTNDAASSQFRLEFLLKTFLATVASGHRHPLVLALDDIQWADAATLDLIATIIVDPDLKGTLIVGLYRQTEEDAHFVETIQQKWVQPFFYEQQQHIKSNKSNNNSHPSESVPSSSRLENLTLRLGGLSLEDAETLVKDTFLPPLPTVKGKNDDNQNNGDETDELTTSSTSNTPPGKQCRQQIRELASLLLDQTIGNCFYMRETVLSLKRSSFIQYDPDRDQLEWNKAHVEDFLEELHCNAEDDLVDDNNGAGNLEGLLLTKLRYLSNRLQWCIALASLLRCPFTVADLMALLPTLNDLLLYPDKSRALVDSDIPLQELTQELDTAVTEGLLDNPIGSLTYRFAHDRVQEAAHSLLMLRLPEANNSTHHENDPGEYFHRMTWIIGTYLTGETISRSGDAATEPFSLRRSFFHQSTSSTSETTSAAAKMDKLSSAPNVESRRFYVGVNHLNSVPLHVPLKLQENSEFLYQSLEDVSWRLVSLNLMAGEKASRQGALIPALQYFDASIRLLELKPEQEMWTHHYDVCFPAFLRAADISFSLGRFEKGERLIRQTLRHAKTMEEKMDAYYVLGEGMGAAGRNVEAYEAGKVALKLMKKYPRFINPINLFLQLGEIKKLMSKLTDDDILSFPVMQDKLSIKVLSIMTNTAIRAHMVQQPVAGILLLWQLLFAVLKGKQLFPAAVEAFSLMGNLSFGPFNDLPLGRRCCKLSMILLDKLNSRDHWTRAMYVNICYVRSWDEPLPKMLEATKRGYRRGMGNGDMEFGFLHMALHTVFLFVAGENLGTYLPNLDSLYSLTQQYKSDMCFSFTVPIRKMIMDLTGATEGDPFIWYHDKNHDRRLSKLELKSRANSQVWFHMTRAITAYILGEIEISETARARIGSIQDDLSYPNLSTHTFYTALICAAVYRRTKRRKYKRDAKQKLKLMRSFLDQRGLRIVHRSHIMEADYVSSTKKGQKDPEMMRKLFDKGIVTSTRAGFTHDAALANELAGEYFLRRAQKSQTGKHENTIGEDLDTFWARTYLSTAYGLYKTWGARAKTDRMEANRSEFVDLHSDLANRGHRLHRPDESSFLNQVSSAHHVGEGERCSQFFSVASSDMSTTQRTAISKEYKFSSVGSVSSARVTEVTDGISLGQSLTIGTPDNFQSSVVSVVSAGSVPE